METEQFTRSTAIKSDALPVGATLFCRYEVLRNLDGDDLYEVYDCMDRLTGEACTVREYFPRALAFRAPDGVAVSPKDDRMGEAFVRGARSVYETGLALTALRGSRNVLGVRDSFFENGTACAVEDREEGMSLKTFLRRRGQALTEGELCYLLDALSDGLIVIHSLNLVHGNIGLSSIFLEKDGTAKLVDFGAPRQISRGLAPLADPFCDFRMLGEALTEAALGIQTPKNALLRTNALKRAPEPLRGVLQRLLDAGTPLGYNGIFDLKHEVDGIELERVRPNLDGLPPMEGEIRTERGEDERKRTEPPRPPVKISLILAALLVLAIIALSFVRS